MRGMITQGKALATAFFLLTVSAWCVGQTNPMHVARNQTFSTNFYDYEALLVNPSLIAANRKEGKRFSLGLMQTNMMLFNRPLKRDLLHGGDASRLGDGAHWFNDILPERLALNMENTLLGLNFHVKKAGSFALSARTNIYVESEINGVFEDLNLEGGSFTNITDVIMQTITENPDNLPPGENSYVKASVINEFNLGWSRRVLKKDKIQLYLGVGTKYLLGFADMGMQFNGHQLAGHLALSSLLPEDWDQTNIVGSAKSEKKFGHGFGGSLGTTLIVDKLKVGVSVMDLGFLRWPSKYMYITKEDVAMEYLSEQDIEKAMTNTLSDFKRSENGTELLPARMTMGASYAVHRFVQFYLDFAAPLISSPRGLSHPTVGLGTWLSAKDVLTIRVGPSLTHKKSIALPLYLSLFTGKNKSFEMSLGTTDLLSIFKENREYLQMETAMMKFHF